LGLRRDVGTRWPSLRQMMFFFSSRRRHTRWPRDWSSDVCSSDLTPELKRREEGDFARAWGGIASLQFGLSIVWTEARRRGMTIETISRLMSSGPASIAGIAGRKGIIDRGYDADIIVFDPDGQFRVTPEIIEH